MPLVLSDEQIMLRDNARGFLSKKAPIAHLRHLRDTHDADGFSRPLWKDFVEMGWAGILVPQNYGGLGLGHVEAGVVMEELGRTLTPSPFLSTAILAANALARAGNEKQKSEYLSRIVAGDLIGTLAVDESAKHRPEKTAMAATRSGSGFILNGVKTFVLDGHVANLFIVAARTAGTPGETKGVTLFLVDSTAKGIRVERTPMVDTHNAARVTFENVNVAADNVLGKIDAGWDALEGTLNVGRAVVAAELMGAADEAFTRTVGYLRERKQFGRLIGEFQALQHRAANLYCELEVSRSAVLKALQMLDESFESAGAIVSVAKAKAGQSATLAVQEAVQMHGGIGMTDEFDVGLFMKRVRVGQELFGDANFHADRLARLNRY
ncbi:MAG TPA: acyl-CoA dehydrogenase family protein [Candidatus Dormibacteraeota bacterium]|nr:acyl-CoA dehydrogenase family protein [Candidatus Dormibacteraeota bacterium]